MSNPDSDTKRLSHDQYFVIRSHIRERFLDKKQLPSTFSQYARKLTKDLGFPVASGSLASVCAKEGIASTHAKPRGELRAGPQMAQLKERVTRLEEYILTIEARVTNLETRSPETRSPEALPLPGVRML